MKLLIVLVFMFGALILIGAAIVLYYGVLLMLAMAGVILMTITGLSLMIGGNVHPLAGVATFIALSALTIHLARDFFNDKESTGNARHPPPP